jgi:hypothetical protein
MSDVVRVFIPDGAVFVHVATDIIVSAFDVDWGSACINSHICFERGGDISVTRKGRLALISGGSTVGSDVFTQEISRLSSTDGGDTSTSSTYISSVYKKQTENGKTLIVLM